MKIRADFVSNSSSSSFILYTPEEIADFTSMTNTKIYLVKDLIANLEKIRGLVLQMQNVEGPPFIFSYLGNHELWEVENRLTGLRAITAKSPDACITDPYDRDEAYRSRMEFDEYEGDL